MKRNETALKPKRVILETHGVRIDANDEDHAKHLERALTNDGFRVKRFVHRIVTEDDGKTFTMERELV